MAQITAVRFEIRNSQPLNNSQASEAATRPAHCHLQGHSRRYVMDHRLRLVVESRIWTSFANGTRKL
jgi:hypothetical protein